MSRASTTKPEMTRLNEMYRLYNKRLWWKGLITEGFLEGVAFELCLEKKISRIVVKEERRTF